jgi:hypothetical protein
MIEGGCRCGAVRYEAEGQHAHHALCHCRDCQMASGAPVLAWLAMPADGFRVTKGEPTRYTAPSGSTRAFCGTCGTPMFFVNEKSLPGIVDIQSVTLDDPDTIAPLAQIQTAERRVYMAELGNLPAFARFPGMD